MLAGEFSRAQPPLAPLPERSRKRDPLKSGHKVEGDGKSRLAPSFWSGTMSFLGLSPKPSSQLQQDGFHGRTCRFHLFPVCPLAGGRRGAAIIACGGGSKGLSKRFSGRA